VNPSPQQDKADVVSAPSNRSGTDDVVNAVLTTRLFVVVCLVLVLIGGLLVLNLWFQHSNYQTAIAIALKEDGPSHDHIVTYARAWDFAVAKTSSLFVSFLLIFVGALYVLRAGQSSFALKVTGVGSSGALESSSPGLVMIALGVTLTVLTFYRDTTVRVSTKAESVAAADADLPKPNSPTKDLSK